MSWISGLGERDQPRYCILGTPVTVARKLARVAKRTYT